MDDKVTDEELFKFSMELCLCSGCSATRSMASELIAFRRQAQEAPKAGGVQSAEKLLELIREREIHGEDSAELIEADRAAQRSKGAEEAFRYYSMISTYPNLPDGDERKKAYFCGVADATKPDAGKGE